jgi:hypothetical protein
MKQNQHRPIALAFIADMHGQAATDIDELRSLVRVLRPHFAGIGIGSIANGEEADQGDEQEAADPFECALHWLSPLVATHINL